MAGNAKQSCKIVYIPADPHEEICEQQIEYTEANEVSCVQDHAKAHFKRRKPKKTAEQLAAQKQAMLAQIPEEQRKGISDALLSQSLDMGMVEHLSLISNATDNNFTGVTMYCDDEAQALNLPQNFRASEIATCAGKPTDVRGDIFIARTFDNEDEFKRLDFTISEVSSRAPWVKEALKQNERKKKAESANVALERLERLHKVAKSKTKIRELSPAESEKESGNSCFKNGQYEEALQHYTKSIELDSEYLVAYNNRAMTYLKLEKYLEAIQDTDFVLKVDSKNAKALFRRANAREKLGQNAEAIEAYKKVFQLEPNIKAAKERIQTLQS